LRIQRNLSNAVRNTAEENRRTGTCNFFKTVSDGHSLARLDASGCDGNRFISGAWPQTKGEIQLPADPIMNASQLEYRSGQQRIVLANKAMVHLCK